MFSTVYKNFQFFLLYWALLANLLKKTSRAANIFDLFEAIKVKKWKYRDQILLKPLNSMRFSGSDSRFRCEFRLRGQRRRRGWRTISAGSSGSCSRRRKRGRCRLSTADKTSTADDGSQHYNLRPTSDDGQQPIPRRQGLPGQDSGNSSSSFRWYSSRPGSFCLLCQAKAGPEPSGNG